MMFSNHFAMLETERKATSQYEMLSGKHLSALQETTFLPEVFSIPLQLHPLHTKATSSAKTKTKVLLSVFSASRKMTKIDVTAHILVENTQR